MHGKESFLMSLFDIYFLNRGRVIAITLFHVKVNGIKKKKKKKKKKGGSAHLNKFLGKYQ